MAVEHLHFERLDTRPAKLEQEYNVDSLEAFLNLYGRSGWKLIYFNRLSSSEAELIFVQTLPAST